MYVEVVFVACHLHRKFISVVLTEGLQCFDAVGWAAGRASGL